MVQIYQPLSNPHRKGVGAGTVANDVPTMVAANAYDLGFQKDAERGTYDLGYQSRGTRRLAYPCRRVCACVLSVF